MTAAAAAVSAAVSAPIVAVMTPAATFTFNKRRHVTAIIFVVAIITIVRIVSAGWIVNTSPRS